MSPLRNVLAVAVLTATAAYAVACAAPPAGKTLVVDCDKKANADEPDCKDSDVTGSSSKKGRNDTQPLEGDPAGSSTSSSPASGTGSDAGADSGSSKPPAPVLGFFCGKLDGCCKALAKKGITGSANQCASVVTTKNEFACDSTYQTYRTPDEYYDPPTECQ
jgi:hypothetical protein